MEKQLTQLFLLDNVSESSVLSYITALRKIAHVKKLESLDFIYDVETVMTNIKMLKKKEATDNTVKTRLTAILTTLRVIGADSQLVNTYKNYHDEIKKRLLQIEESGVKNDKQIAYYMTEEEIDSVTQRLKSKATGKKSSFNSRQDYLLWSLYTKMSPRRNLDYWLMDIVTDDVDWRTLPIERNYYMVKQQRMIYNQHKNTRTANERGIVEQIDLSDNQEMIEILTNYINCLPPMKLYHTKYIPILCYRNGIRWERSTYIYERLSLIAGKKLGSNALRHIMAENVAPPREELTVVAKQAKEMGHSIAEHITTYVKKSGIIDKTH